MASERCFGGVSAAVWNCLKETSKKQHGTVYNPPDANQGTATTKTPVGTVELSFDYTPDKDTACYKIIKKPFIVGSSQIWDGIQETIDECGQH